MQTSPLFFRFLRLSTLFVAGTFVHFSLAQSSAQVPANPWVLPNQPITMEFRWQGDSLRHTWNPRAALLVPVKLRHCPRLFYMQFDLGAPYSLFYKNKVAAIGQKYPDAIQLSDSTSALENLSIQLNQVPLEIRTVAVRQVGPEGIDWSTPDSLEIIGTLGADLIENRIFWIDYPTGQMGLATRVPAQWQDAHVESDFHFVHRRVLLPATLHGKSTLLYFDTGSSSFELLTDPATWQQLAAPSAQPASYPVNSWGTLLTAHTVATHDSLELGAHRIPIRYVTKMEGVNAAQEQQMRKVGIGGMIGNALFLDYVLLLDTQRQKFGLFRGR